MALVADREAVQVRSRPPHGRLEHVVELRHTNAGRDEKAAPHRGLDVDERDAQLEHTLAGRGRHTRHNTVAVRVRVWEVPLESRRERATSPLDQRARSCPDHERRVTRALQIGRPSKRAATAPEARVVAAERLDVAVWVPLGRRTRRQGVSADVAPGAEEGFREGRLRAGGYATSKQDNCGSSDSVGGEGGYGSSRAQYVPVSLVPAMSRRTIASPCESARPTTSVRS